MLDDTAAPTLSDCAREALDGADTRKEAADRLLARAKADPALYQMLMAPMEEAAALRAVNGAVGSQRYSVWTAGNRSAAQAAATAGSDRLKRAVHPNSYTMLDFRLPGPGNVLLRDAKKSDLVEAVKYYRHLSSDAGHKARWLEALADRVGRKRVGNALSLDEIERLQADTAE